MTCSNKELRKQIKVLQSRLDSEVDKKILLLNQIIDLQEEIKRLEGEVEKANELMQ